MLWVVMLSFCCYYCNNKLIDWFCMSFVVWFKLKMVSIIYWIVGEG